MWKSISLWFSWIFPRSLRKVNSISKAYWPFMVHLLWIACSYPSPIDTLTCLFLIAFWGVLYTVKEINQDDMMEYDGDGPGKSQRGWGPKDEGQPAIVRTGTSVFQAEGRARSKPLGWEHICHIPGTARGLRVGHSDRAGVGKEPRSEREAGVRSLGLCSPRQDKSLFYTWISCGEGLLHWIPQPFGVGWFEDPNPRHREALWRAQDLELEKWVTIPCVSHAVQAGCLTSWGCLLFRLWMGTGWPALQLWEDF